MDDKTAQAQLHRGLSARAISMITLGGSIGTGIFLASGATLALAGPGGTMVAYLLMGILVYFLMTSLGEMAAFMPASGSFYLYASRFLDPSLGYALGWNYWYSCAVYIASELAASALVMQFWFPASPSFFWCALFLTVIVAFNAISTKTFGTIESWMSFIKITVILLFIVAGLMLACGMGGYPGGGFANWQVGDGPFHSGFSGIMAAFIVAGFSFQGTELLGVAAGESHNPQKNVPRAVRMVFWRILFFFVLSLFVISLLIPYTASDLVHSELMMSPFTLVFKYYNKNFAAGIMNCVILIAIISTANSSMYAGSRILWYLAKERHIPAIFAKVNRRGIPVFALLLTTIIAMFAFLSSIFGNGTVYFWLLNATSLSGFIAWLGIAISHYRFRKAYIYQGKDLADLPYLAKGYPFVPLSAFAACLFIIAAQNYQALTRSPIDWYGLIIAYIGIPLFFLVWFTHKWLKKTRIVPLAECNFET